MERSYLPTISGYLHRPRVDALIRKGLEYPLVFVVAGPGYGKTLSVAHYLKTADVRLIYMRLSKTRTSAADFWEDGVKATRRELPEYADRLETLGFPDSAGAFEQFREIATETAEAGKRLVFVVDSYERCVDSGITQFLGDLVDSDLPNYTMFILCNIIITLDEALPASGQFRITDEDLIFTTEEAKLMFEQYGADAPPDIIERAVRATGGWPLGLRLVCESHPEVPENYSSRSPMHIIANLHENHYFRKYPKDMQTQLVLLSLLPQFSMDMVCAEMEMPKDTFAHVLMRHPFVSYDYVSGLFTFQTMYHDFLRQRQTFLSRESRRETCILAGRWFLAHAMVDEAMDCFWEASDYDGFMDAVYALPKTRTHVEKTNRILQRLEQIPGSYAGATPGVEYAMAFMVLNAADIPRAKELYLNVERRLLALPDSPVNRAMLGGVYTALADIGNYLNEDSGLAWMKKAYEIVPNGSSAHSPELLSLGGGSAFFLPNNQAGQLEHMVEYMFEFAKYADKVKNGCGFGYEYLFAGEAAYYREDMDKAATMFNSAAMKALRTGQHDIFCNALWNLGRIEAYFGNHKKTLARLNEIDAHVNENHLLNLYEMRDFFAFWFYWRLGDIGKIPTWFGNTMAGPESAPISMAKKQLTGAQYLYLTGDLTKSRALLLQLEAMLESRGHWLERLNVYILKALHHKAAAEPEPCLQAFRAVYDMVYANNLKLCLSGYGKDMVGLLEYLKKQEPSGYDTAWLDVVCQDAVSLAKRTKVMQAAYKGRDYKSRSKIALTTRENETLHFLAQGLTQKEIGRMMGITDNAVKKHLSKIYQKLGAVNRADAIHIASMSGLVDAINT